MGRRLSMSGGLGIKMVLAFFHCFGSAPALQHLLKYFARFSIEPSLRFLNALFMTRSEPAANRLLRSCRAARTSSMSMSRSRFALGRAAVWRVLFGGCSAW
uniref:Putative secreted protein n=1 Tax=Ixodes ricinus TaxID=34613 RepID=A0A147BNS8_IXORI